MFNYVDHEHKDAYRSRSEWLEMTEGWEDPYGVPLVVNHEGVEVVRDDFIVGTKARACDFLISNISNDVLVYVAPREGAAPIALIDAARRHGKKVKLFMPSSKRVSETQAVAIERGADVEFHRIAAMPNLNKIAAAWAEDNGAYFVPLGLRHELATAALIRVGDNLIHNGFHPEEMVVATSTGVLVRALQIAFQDTRFISYAVARNLKSGEKGCAKFVSDTRPFLKDTKYPCPFPSYDNYDRKAWEYAHTHQIESMWNVAAKPILQDKTLPDRVDSYRDWPKKED